MKKLAIVLLLVAGLASPAMADPMGQTGMLDQTRVAGYYAGTGGEFTVFHYTGLNNFAYAPAVSNLDYPDPSFQTFCLETDEYTGPYPTLYTVNDEAVMGGAGGPSPDPISLGTAWLYSQFVNGTLAGYFTGTRSTQAGLLQNAIWMLEQEIGLAANPYYALAAGQFLNPMADAPTGYLDIYVLNTTGRDQSLRQDFLWADYVPTPDGGATLMLLGGALFGLGALRRKVGR